MRANKIVLALGMAGLATLAGCGGDGGSTTASSSSVYSVKAIDGYLRNAKVWLDVNRNNVFDEGEPSAVSGEGGVAELDVSNVQDYESYPVFVQAIANQTVDEDSITDQNKNGTPITVGYMMSAPAGEVAITPLSAMVNLHMIQSNADLTDPLIAEQVKKEAVRMVAGQLGVEEADLLGDLVEQGSEEAQFAAQSIVASGAVLPKTPDEMVQLVEEVESNPDAFNQTSEAVNEVIREVIEETPPEALETTPPPISEQDDLESDEDKDGIPDLIDAFPNDANEYLDSDKDGVGNNADTNDDSVPDPNNEGSFIDDNFEDDVDRFPINPLKAGDHDNDGVDSIDDVMPYDHDNDGHDDDVDAFDDDPNEWLDSDGDSIGDNADLNDDSIADPNNAGEFIDDEFEDTVDLFPTDPDKAGDHDGDGQDSLIDDDDDNDGVNDSDDLHPFDDTQAGDPDKDGIDTLLDAYPNDGTKSVADQTASNSAYLATLNINHREVMMLNVNVEKRIETFNNDSVQTTVTTTYTTKDNDLYGQIESIDLESDGRFTRIEAFNYDFNLDGNAQFIGQTLDIGTRSADSETYWRYVDESDAAPEGGVNDDEPRTYDDLDFSGRVHPVDLSGIDTIQKFAVAFSESNDGTTYTTDFFQYLVDGFAIDDASKQVKEYASHGISIEKNLLRVVVVDEQDWGADGSVNTRLGIESQLDGAYRFAFEGPVFANPTDGIDQEYADVNFTSGNWDNLTSHWNAYAVEVLSTGDKSELGRRYVLSSDNTKQTEGANEEAYKFHQWLKTSKTISDTETTEQIQWTHFPLSDYSFTAKEEEVGQAYRVNLKQPNDLWVTYSFDEWGSQHVDDLEGKVETMRAGGTALTDIHIDGLSRNGVLMPTASFQYDEQGQSVQWYAVTQEPRLTDGTPTLVDLTLAPDGVIPGSFVMSMGTDIVLVAPNVDNPAPWYSNYYRQHLNTYDLNLDPLAFSWTTDLGQLFLDETLAQERLNEVLNPQYSVCHSENTGEISGEVDTYMDFVAAAYNCGFIGIDASYLTGVTLYYHENAQNILGYQFNANGGGVYSETVDDSTGSFTWRLTPEGIVEVDNDGDMEYFAFIANQDNRYSMLGFFTWDDKGASYSEIIGMEFTTDVPNTGDYRICSEHNSGELSGAGNVDDYASYLDDAVSCGYQALVTPTVEGQTLYFVENADSYLSYQFNADNKGIYYESKDDSSGEFGWQLNSDGIIEVDNDGDMEYFAYLAHEHNKFSMLGLFKWHEDVANDAVPYSEILGMEFLTSVPQKAYQECTTGDTEWVNDQPTSSPTLVDYAQAIDDCGGVVASAANILSGQTIYRQRGNGEIRAFEFNPDGTGHYYKNDYRHSDFTWVIEGDYVKIEYGVDDYEYFAYLNGDGQQFGLKILSAWPENGQSISEIWFERFSYNKPDVYSLRSCPIDEALTTRLDVTEAEFREVVAACGGHTDLSTANYDGDLSGYTYVRINSQGETRGFEFLADSVDARSGSYNRLKNGMYRGSEGRSWQFTDEFLILTDGVGSTYDRLTLANISYVDAADGDTAQSSFVAYEEMVEGGQVIESLIWSFVFREYDQNHQITACDQSDSTWDSDKDQPADFATYDEFEQAVQSCRVLTDDRELKFTDSMLVPEGSISTVWSLGEGETLTFNSNKTGVWSEPNETAYAFSWTINDQGYVVMGFDNKDVEALVLTESNSKGYSIKGYWQPSDYEAAGWTEPRPSELGLGEVWSGVLSFQQALE